MLKFVTIPLGFLLITSLSCQNRQTDNRWCDELPRDAYTSLTKLSYSDGWFEVYEVQDSVFALYEPLQWQEVISYLILGDEFALLFDTGNGIGDISQVVSSITTLPVRVLNSHAHYDHVGGNADFDLVYGMDTPFTVERQTGMLHHEVAAEVSDEALCNGLPKGKVAEEHRIRPYEIDLFVTDGFVLNLGSRQLEVISIPGHSPDAIALVDKKNGLLDWRLFL